jgi:hypothetical protein
MATGNQKVKGDRIMNAIFAVAILVFSQTINGRVVAVTDGDTIVVLDNNNQQHKVRLAEIDAPEKSQPFGTAAKNALSNKIFGENVAVNYKTIDRYGRVVGYVNKNNRNINLEMAEEGFAWQYNQYSKDPAYAIAQRNAQQNQLGLWQQPFPTPPWEYRRNKSTTNKSTTTKPTTKPTTKKSKK